MTTLSRQVCYLICMAHGDIDECKTKRICREGSFCVNTMGSYYCRCKEGYSKIKNVCIPGNCSSNRPPCSENEECTVVTNNSYKCTCKEGYSFNGTLCAEDVHVQAEVVFERVFTEELKNQSSPEYIELKKNFTEALTNLFKDTPNFKEVIVTNLTKGSVKVIFKVIYFKRDKEIKKVRVAEILIEEAKKGNIEGIKIKPDGIVIKEPPPPPINISYNYVKTNEISINWTRPKQYEFFSIREYVISYEAIREFEFNDTKKIIPNDGKYQNGLLSNLKSDTFYAVTVYGVNSYGNGDRGKILEVKTLKPSKPEWKLAVIIVVVVVVLLGLFLLIGYMMIRSNRLRIPLRKANKEQRRKKFDDGRHREGYEGEYSENPAETDKNSMKLQIAYRNYVYEESDDKEHTSENI